ncbi:hypothetical protein C7M51_02137 [Mixta intestinalis]|uniref:Uncharacterized protein n=1 Tax=Mixta intestinalis TaxID=1615494 RepID=A0A6P1Q1Y3_9GAMM|nr:hypothetical protein C7M51_02137 [Mixta intestinalis]
MMKRPPQRQKIETGTKAGFRSDKQRTRMVSKTGGQAVAAKKNILSLQQAVLIRKVDVIEFSGYRCTLIVPVQFSVFNW